MATAAPNPPTPSVDSGDVQVQPSGFLLELSPDWLIARASENTHSFLGEYHQRMIGEPMSSFTLAQPLHDLRNLLSRQGASNGIARAYRVRLIDEPRHFDIAFQMIDGRILLEGVPSIEGTFGSALGSVGRLIEGLESVPDSALLDNAVRRVRALTGFDRVSVTIHHDGEDRSAQSSRGTFAPRDKPHHLDDLPAIVPNTGAASVSLFPRNPHDRAPHQALFRSPSATHLEELREQGIASSLEVPISVRGETIGYFECENRQPVEPNLEMHAAVELFARVIAMRLAGARN